MVTRSAPRKAAWFSLELASGVIGQSVGILTAMNEPLAELRRNALAALAMIAAVTLVTAIVMSMI